MAWVKETVIEAMLERLQGSPSIVPASDNVRRSHRTWVPREQCPAVHVADGGDEPRRDRGGCAIERECVMTVSILVRNDDGYSDAATIAENVMARLDPDNQAETPYPAGVTVEPGRIGVDDEIADADILRLVMEFRIRYLAANWSLSAAS